MLEALVAIGRHQVLTATQLAFVVERPTAEVRAGLDPLVAEKLITMMETLAVGAEGRTAAFALTARGARLLSDATGRVSSSIPRPDRALYMLGHELAVADFALALEGLDERGVIQLLRWETARTRIGDVAQLVERGEVRRVPLVADGLAVVEEARPARQGILVEIDMGTVSLARMRRKFEGYWRWVRDGDHIRRFGLPALRVLIVVKGTTRLEKLLSLANELQGGRGSRLFWFVLQAPVSGPDFCPRVPLCWVSGEGGQHPLFVARPGGAQAGAGGTGGEDLGSPVPPVPAPALAA
jgi:hypothetical protein